jgi:hypothetical protein
MRKICLSLAMAATALTTLPALAATDVAVSIGISQPGVYGRIDIGRVPVAPVLVYPQPVVIVPGPVAVVQRPIYMHVPPGHAKNWRKHCGAYNACGQPVYFVQDDWYVQQYGGGGKSGKKGKSKGHNGKGKHN